MSTVVAIGFSVAAAKVCAARKVTVAFPADVVSMAKAFVIPAQAGIE